MYIQHCDVICRSYMCVCITTGIGVLNITFDGWPCDSSALKPCKNFKTSRGKVLKSMIFGHRLCDCRGSLVVIRLAS